MCASFHHAGIARETERPTDLNASSSFGYREEYTRISSACIPHVSLTRTCIRHITQFALSLSLTDDSLVHVSAPRVARSSRRVCLELPTSSIQPFPPHRPRERACVTHALSTHVRDLLRRTFPTWRPCMELDRVNDRILHCSATALDVSCRDADALQSQVHCWPRERGRDRERLADVNTSSSSVCREDHTRVSCTTHVSLSPSEHAIALECMRTSNHAPPDLHAETCPPPQSPLPLPSFFYGQRAPTPLLTFNPALL
jgi:hypothetical protein